MGYVPKWMTTSEAIQHVRAVAGGTLTDAVNELVAALRDGEVSARWWGTDEIIAPMQWYRRLTLFEDGSVVRCVSVIFIRDIGPQVQKTEVCLADNIERFIQSFYRSLDRQLQRIQVCRADIERIWGVMPTPPHLSCATAGQMCKSLDRDSANSAYVEQRPASDRQIHAAITSVYDTAAEIGEKPPNLNQIVAPVQARLLAGGHKASGRHIKQLAEEPQHAARRRKPGRTIASEKGRALKEISQ